MKKIATLFLSIFVTSFINQTTFTNDTPKTFLNRNAIGFATIIGGIAEFKDMPPKTKAICNTLALVFLVYRSAEQLPQHTQKYRSGNNFSLIEGLYSLSAATFIGTSIAKCVKEMRAQPNVHANIK